MMVSMSVCLSVCLCVRLSFNQTRKTFLSGSDLTEADRDGEYVLVFVCLSVCLSVRVSMCLGVCKRGQI